MHPVHTVEEVDAVQGGEIGLSHETLGLDYLTAELRFGTFRAHVALGWARIELGLGSGSD